MSIDNIETRLEDFYLLPLWKDSKIPFTKHGFLDAKRGLPIKKLQEYYNIGLALKSSNLFAIDMDIDSGKGLNGIETIAALEKELGALPTTLTQITPRGGKHLIFKADGINNPKGKLGKDVDLKYNGYIVIYPSVINGKKYAFTDGIDEKGNFIIATLPKTWLDYINKPVIPNNLYSNKADYYFSRRIIDGDFDKMYSQCAFVKHCVDSANILSEPEWHIFACICNSIKHGNSLFHKYSQPYNNYNYLQAQQKFENAKKYSVNCNTISRFYDGCNYCQYRNSEV